MAKSKLKSGKKAPPHNRVGALRKETYDQHNNAVRRRFAGSDRGLVKPTKKTVKLKSGKRKKK